MDWLGQMGEGAFLGWMSIAHAQARRTFCHAFRLAGWDGVFFYPFIGMIFGGVFVFVFKLAAPEFDTDRLLAEVGPTIVSRFSPPAAALLVAACAGSTISSWIGQMTAMRVLDAFAVLGNFVPRYITSPAWFGLTLAGITNALTFAIAVTLVFAGYIALTGSPDGLEKFWSGFVEEHQVAGALLKTAGFSTLIAGGNAWLRDGSEAETGRRSNFGDTGNRLVVSGRHGDRTDSPRSRLSVAMTRFGRFRRGLMLLVTLVLLILWVFATMRLGGAGSRGEEFVLYSPVPGQVADLGYGEPITVRGRVKGFDECTVNDTRFPIEQGGFHGKFPVSSRTIGERLLWFDVQCLHANERSRATEWRYARHLRVKGRSTASHEKWEVARVYLKLAGFRKWLSEKIEEPFEAEIRELKGKDVKTDRAEATIKDARLSDIQVRALPGSVGLAAHVTLEATVDPYMPLVSDRKITWSKTVYFPLQLEYRDDAWKVSVHIPSLSGSIKAVGGRMWFGISRRINKDIIKEFDGEVLTKLTCDDERDCIRKKLAKELNAAVNDNLDSFVDKTPQRLARFLAEHEFGARLVELGKRMGFRLVAGAVPGNGPVVYFSLAVDHAWLRATPPAFRAGRTGNNDLGIFVSFSLINRFMEEFFDRSFCTDVLRDFNAAAHGLA